jgi:hypothetical protein
MTTYTVPISKIGDSVDFDWDSLPEASRDYVVMYGFKKSINDTHASVTRDKYDSGEAYLAAVHEKVDERIEQIRSGNVPGTRAAADPHAQKARKLAKELSDSELEAALEWIMKKRARAA